MGGRRHKHDGCSWSVSNENPISKRGACGVYGGEEEEKEKKKQTKRGPKNCLAKTRKASQILRARGDNDLQLPAVLFSILDKSKGNEEKEEEEGVGRERGSM